MTHQQTAETVVKNRRHETHDIVADAYSFGAIAARATDGWLTSWWSDMALPVSDDGSLPLTEDLYLHAGAVGVLMQWEWADLQDRLPPELPTAKTAFDSFVERIANFGPSAVSDTSGAKLFFRLREVHEQMFVPSSFGLTVHGTGVMMTGKRPSESAIDCLASLLADFSDIIDRSDQGGVQ